MKKICLLLILAATLFMTQPGFSQIYFKNNNPEAVYVTFAQYKGGANPPCWITRGWFTVNSGKVFTAFETIGVSDTIGYWATTLLSGMVYEGKKPLLVHNDEKFTIRNADKESVLRQNPTYEWRYFRLIKIKPGITTGTINL
ncbi:MAG: DUF1036 domain-containing protein [bacterium]